MTGPHPVVGIAAELTYRRGRRTHHADVGKHLSDKEQVLVAAEHVSYHHPLAHTELYLGGQLLDVLLYGLGTFGFAHAVVNLVKNGRSHILYALDECHLQARRGYLLGKRSRPETVFEVIVLNGAVALYGTVTAVVVGKDQSLV